MILRFLLYLFARLLGDWSAIKHNREGRRMARRVAVQLDAIGRRMAMAGGA